MSSQRRAVVVISDEENTSEYSNSPSSNHSTLESIKSNPEMPNVLKQMQQQQLQQKQEQKRQSLETDEDSSSDDSETDETTSDVTVTSQFNNGNSPSDSVTAGTARDSMAGLDDFYSQDIESVA
jgi:hypothetical protein